MFADNTEYDNDMDYNSADDNFDDSDSKGNVFFVYCFTGAQNF